MDKKDDCFFLHIQELLGQLGLTNITKKNLDELLRESQVIRRAMERMMK
jgi:hypothetical protein